uniref:Putative secreted protein n=1 Tax=Anopheles darlingi TaxID=43151 RepID=A0A2M4D9E6_ANODA
MVDVCFGMFLARVAAASGQQRTKIFGPSRIRSVQFRGLLAGFLLLFRFWRGHIERKDERPVLLSCLQIHVACIEHVHPGRHEFEHHGRIVRTEAEPYPFLWQCLTDGRYDRQDGLAGYSRNEARIVRVQSFDQITSEIVLRLSQPLDRLLAQLLTVPANDGSNQTGVVAAKLLRFTVPLETLLNERFCTFHRFLFPFLRAAELRVPIVQWDV